MYMYIYTYMYNTYMVPAEYGNTAAALYYMYVYLYVQ